MFRLGKTTPIYFIMIDTFRCARYAFRRNLENYLRTHRSPYKIATIIYVNTNIHGDGLFSTYEIYLSTSTTNYHRIFYVHIKYVSI